MYPGVVAALAVGSLPYVAQLLPAGHAQGWLLFPALLICLFGVINLIGTRFSAAVMSFVNGFKLVILFALVGWAVVSGHAHVCQPAALHRTPPRLGPTLSGDCRRRHERLLQLWRLVGGKQDCRGNPQSRGVPCPLRLSAASRVVTAIYLLISAAFLAVLPIDQVYLEHRFCRAVRRGAVWRRRRARSLRLCAGVRLRRHRGHHHGCTTRLLRHGTIRRVLFRYSESCIPASAHRPMPYFCRPGLRWPCFSLAPSIACCLTSSFRRFSFWPWPLPRFSD